MPEGATDRAGPPGRSGWGAFLPVENAPPLSGLAAMAAFAAMMLNQVLLPGLGTEQNPLLLGRLARAGQFAANLAVISGVIAFTFCAVAIVRGHPPLALVRRVLWILLSLVLLRAALIAALFERVETTRENVYLAVAAGNTLGVLAGVYALERTRGSLLRLVALLATCLPLFSIISVLLEITADVQLDPWKRRGHEWSQALGEVSYVGVLLASFPMLVPRGLRLRDLVARSAGIAVLVASVYALRTAEAALNSDYPVLFYHAQRVGLMLDRWPLAYAVPFCLALSAVTTALIAEKGPRWQAAAAVLLLFAAGYAPKAPGRLLSMALGFVLLGRALVGLAQLAPKRAPRTRDSEVESPSLAESNTPESNATESARAAPSSSGD